MTASNVTFAGYPCVRIENAQGSITVSLHGGQLLSWLPAGQREVFWLSSKALPAPAAIRGGVPVCWPWFGKQGMPAGAMQHGPVRNLMWRPVHMSVNSAGHDLLSLEPVHTLNTPSALDRYASDLVVRLDIELGATLTMGLHTHNRGTHDFALTQALHSYFAVGDVQAVQLQGVEGLHYASRVDASSDNLQRGPFTLNEVCDNTYAHTRGPLVRHYKLIDPAWNRVITLQTHGSDSLVVWNPGAEGSRAMADVPVGAWEDFLCVEAANAGSDVVVLAPGARHALYQTLRCEANSVVRAPHQ